MQKELSKGSYDILEKTLEEIDKDIWPSFNFETTLMQRVYEIRKKKIKAFTFDDYRIAIAQNICGPLLIPLVLDDVKRNLLIEAFYYPGDLLMSILRSPYWSKHPAEKKEFKAHLLVNISQVINSDEINDSIKNDIVEQVSNL